MLNFAAYDTDSNGKLSVTELQVIFLVAGGESASGINSPGGVWGMATSLILVMLMGIIMYQMCQGNLS